MLKLIAIIGVAFCIVLFLNIVGSALGFGILFGIPGIIFGAMGALFGGVVALMAGILGVVAGLFGVVAGLFGVIVFIVVPVLLVLGMVAFFRACF